jgi:hypothetical protein
MLPSKRPHLALMALAILVVSAVQAEAAGPEIKITNGTRVTTYSFAQKDGKDIGLLSVSELLLPAIINLQKPPPPPGQQPAQGLNINLGNPAAGFAEFYRQNRNYYILPQGHEFPTNNQGIELLSLRAAHDRALLYSYFGVCPCCGWCR